MAAVAKQTSLVVVVGDVTAIGGGLFSARGTSPGRRGSRYEEVVAGPRCPESRTGRLARSGSTPKDPVGLAGTRTFTGLARRPRREGPGLYPASPPRPLRQSKSHLSGKEPDASLSVSSTSPSGPGGLLRRHRELRCGSVERQGRSGDRPDPGLHHLTTDRPRGRQLDPGSGRPPERPLLDPHSDQAVECRQAQARLAHPHG